MCLLFPSLSVYFRHHRWYLCVSVPSVNLERPWVDDGLYPTSRPLGVHVGSVRVSARLSHFWAHSLSLWGIQGTYIYIHVDRLLFGGEGGGRGRER